MECKHNKRFTFCFYYHQGSCWRHCSECLFDEMAKKEDKGLANVVEEAKGIYNNN